MQARTITTCMSVIHNIDDKGAMVANTPYATHACAFVDKLVCAVHALEHFSTIFVRLTNIAIQPII